LLVEAVNIYNLLFCNDIITLIMNYIVLGIISTFELGFLEPLKSTSLSDYLCAELDIHTFRRRKLVISKDALDEAEATIK